jgi:hypothetical protein
VYGYCYDLAKLDTVRAFAQHVRSDADKFFDNKLHCLLNNAGVFLEDKKISPDGMEMTWAVNTAAPFLLTGQLLDLVINAHGRILNVSSISLADSLDFKARPVVRHMQPCAGSTSSPPCHDLLIFCHGTKCRTMPTSAWATQRTAPQSWPSTCGLTRWQSV